MTETSPDIDVRTDYTDPVRRLLNFGENWENDPAKWPDYAAQFGLGSEHIAELIRLACDTELYGSDPDSTEVWAPVHARRALGRESIQSCGVHYATKVTSSSSFAGRKPGWR